MQSIFNTDAKQPPSIDLFKPLPTGEGVIDEATFKTIEVDALFDAVIIGTTWLQDTCRNFSC
jgi:hypothetical protein